MNRNLTILSIATLLSIASVASALDAKAAAPVNTQDASILKPWQECSFDIESGFLWKVGGSSILNYRLAPVMLSWRSREVFGFDLSNGSYLTVRNRVTAIGEWVEMGAENHYFGIIGAPSIEWWSPTTQWSTYLNIGGGFGLIDSQGVRGGQGQDFTLTWFTAGGVSYRLNDVLSIRTGVMFQHLSNGGATDPNPGVNVLGVTMGVSWAF